jgi:hypothetical protein
VARRHAVAALGAVIACVALAGGRGEAHKPITSPYTYNEDVFPIVRDRCGRCHIAGGVGPMSLLTYKDAFPWGESIRTELIAGHMPPGTVDSSAAEIRNGQKLTARELNLLLTWATGGNPVGNPEHAPPAVAPRSGWPLGQPDLVLQLPAPVVLSEGTPAFSATLTISTGTTEGRWVRAIDLLPETPAIVRSATISVKSQGETADDHRDRMLSLWLPGEDAASLDRAGFWLPPAADLLVRVNYKKTWEYERKEMKDQSSIGLYFAAAPVPAVRAVALTPEGGASGSRISFTQVLAEDERVLAFYPDASLANARVLLDAVRPDGTRIDLLRLTVQPDWIRRYWLSSPLELPKGTRIEGSASRLDQDSLVPPGATPIVSKPLDPAAARITVDVASTARP